MEYLLLFSFQLQEECVMKEQPSIYKLLADLIVQEQGIPAPLSWHIYAVTYHLLFYIHE